MMTRHPRSRPGAVRAACGLLAASLVALAIGGPARAGLVIDPGIAVTSSPSQYFDSSITGQANYAAIEGTIISAINTYEALFTNAQTVNIDFTAMSGGLGQSEDLIYNIGYQNFRGGLQDQYNASHNADQGTALANLPTGSVNPVNGSTSLLVSSADARILGQSTATLLNNSGNSGQGSGFIYDGIISLNTSITFPPGTNNSSNYSLLAVAEHEMDEVLGLGSDVGGTGFFAAPRAQDLYRFGQNSTTRNYTTSGDNAWFSIDGGHTDLVQFNQSGGGADYGDWHTSGTARVQDAFGTPGAMESILTDGGVEITALNVIGYSMQAVPEPSGLALLGCGILAVAAVQRSRRPTTA